MNLIWIIGLVCLSAGAVVSQGDPWVKRKFCGTQLADAMSLVCGGVYNGKKRNVPFTVGDMSNDDYQIEQSADYYTWPYMSSKALAAILGSSHGEAHHLRSRRGIVDECCHNPCSLSDLQAYCG